MTDVLRLAIVDPNDAKRDSLKTMLLGMDVIWLEAECSRYDFFADVVSQTQPDIAMISLDEDPEKGISLINQLRSETPDCSVLAISSSNDGDLILKTMRAGVREFLTLPVKVEELLGALERISNQRFGIEEGRHRGCEVIAITGATGGVGSTSLGVNLGCVLAKNEKNSVVLVDLDLSLGDADIFLDAIPDYTLVDVAQNISRLDFALLKRSLTKHSSGLYLLPRPVMLQDIKLISGEDLQRVLGLLKATFSHVILDLSKSYSPLDLVALEAANQILMVTQLDLPCLRNVVRLMMSFEEIEGLKEKIKIVVNRIGLDDNQISLVKATETIGVDIFWQLPNDYRVMSEVRNNGVPLIDQAPKASITQSMARLADVICGIELTENNSGKGKFGRLLGMWSGKAGSKSEKDS